MLKHNLYDPTPFVSNRMLYTAADPTGTARHGAGRRKSCLAQRDSATSTADLSRDAGLEWAAEAAGRSKHRADASTSRRYWTRTKMEQRTTGGLEEQVVFGDVTRA